MLFIEMIIVCFSICFIERTIHSKRNCQSFSLKAFFKRSFLALSISYLTVFVINSTLSLLSFKAFSLKNFFMVLVVSSLSSFAVLGLSYLINKTNHFKDFKEKDSGGITALRIVTVVLSILISGFFFGGIFINMQWDSVAIEQMLVNMTSPTQGTELGIYLFGFQHVIAAASLVYIVSVFLFSKYIPKLNKTDSKIKKQYQKMCVFLVIICLGGVFVVGFNVIKRDFDLQSGYNCLFVKSDFIEENYVSPEDVKLEAPQKPRNLIFIYLESIENTYLSKDLGGYVDENLMPELTLLANEGVVFSDNAGKFGGPQPIAGTTWSLASMVNQTMGIPLKYTGHSDTYCKENMYLKNTIALGDILNKKGYEQTVMVGSSSVFGGLDNMYRTHGNYKVFDYDYAKENGFIPKNYKVWWGFEDDKLYEFAKDEITRLYKTGKPFNFTMENADTHMPDGYLAPDKPRPYNIPYANAILYSTSQVEKFVRWIMEQPFYENTTVVLIGDHLSMDAKFFSTVDESYHRTQFNLILNSATEAEPSCCTNRQYSNMDMFPTVLAALGYTIEGDRLGLGTNLFSGKKTILEEYGTEYVSNELTKKSEFYNNILAKAD